MLIVDVEMAGNVQLLISLRHPASLVVVLVVVSVADSLVLVLVFVSSLVVVEVAEGRTVRNYLKYLDNNLEQNISAFM